MEANATTLLVKRGPAPGSSSLFEEAIALGKLRGLLATRTELPKDTASRTKLKNGTATIPFQKTLPPEVGADVVVSALSVDGVQRVRAVWTTN